MVLRGQQWRPVVVDYARASLSRDRDRCRSRDRGRFAHWKRSVSRFHRVPHNDVHEVRFRASRNAGSVRRATSLLPASMAQRHLEDMPLGPVTASWATPAAALSAATSSSASTGTTCPAPAPRWGRPGPVDRVCRRRGPRRPVEATAGAGRRTAVCVTLSLAAATPAEHSAAAREAPDPASHH
jgi:hypothetical protein